jgi:hypothetical protein
MSDEEEQSASIAWQIWRESDLPFVEKVAVASRNQLRKLLTRKTCCGHYGEPGC